MLRCLWVVALAFALAAITDGCGGVSSVVYRGSANGVAMAVTVPSKPGVPTAQPKLAIHFTPAAHAVWRRAQAMKLEAFCIWPLKNGGGMVEIGTRLKSKRLALAVGSVGDRPASGAYTCGLHSRSGGAEGSYPWLGYVRSALVAARLRLAH
jgi:hypothetical protein